MIDPTLLEDLGLILVSATLLAVLARRVRIPSIVAYILAGLVLGPFTGLIKVEHSPHGAQGVELISEVGIALLLFLVGLELSFATIRAVGRVAFVAGFVQVGLSALLGVGVALLLGFGVGPALFIGVALSFSSTVVVVKLLEQRGDLREGYGRVTLGILLVQDLLVILVLTFVAGLGGGGSDPVGVLVDLTVAFGGMAFLVSLAVLASARVLPHPLRWIARSPEALLVWSLTWCFLMIVAAETLHLSVELGAFLAGMSLAQLPFNPELRRRVRPLVDFFLAVFFVSLGVAMDPTAALGQWPAALALIAFVLTVKPILLLAVIPRLGFGERTAALSGITLGQTSEFSFILAGLGVEAGLIGPEVLALIGAVGLGTMGISSGLIERSRSIHARLHAAGLLRIFRAPPEGVRDRLDPGGPHGPAAGLPDHVIVIGMNTMGRRIVEELHARGEPTLAVDLDPAKLAGLPVPTLMGSVDDLAVLEAAALHRARLVVSTLHIEDTNNLLAWRCRELGIASAIHAFDRTVAGDLRRIGATHLIESKTSGTRRLTEELAARGIYG